MTRITEITELFKEIRKFLSTYDEAIGSDKYMFLSILFIFLVFSIIFCVVYFESPTSLFIKFNNIIVFINKYSWFVWLPIIVILIVSLSIFFSLKKMMVAQHNTNDWLKFNRFFEVLLPGKVDVVFVFLENKEISFNSTLGLTWRLLKDAKHSPCSTIAYTDNKINYDSNDYFFRVLDINTNDIIRGEADYEIVSNIVKRYIGRTWVRKDEATSETDVMQKIVYIVYTDSMDKKKGYDRFTPFFSNLAKDAENQKITIIPARIPAR